MAVSNLKSLIGKLNETCRSALESAAGLCLSQTHYEVDIEHFLIKLLEMSDTDLLKILKHFEINEAHLVADLTRAIEKFKTGNARTPALSPRIPRMIKESWLLASVEYQTPQVRSGHILVALLDSEDLSRMLISSSETLKKISLESLKESLPDLTSGSGEDVGTTVGGGGDTAAAGTPARPGGAKALDQFTINLTDRPKKAKSTRCWAGISRSARWWIFSSAGARTTLSLPAKPVWGKRPWSRGLPCASLKGDVPPILQNVALHTLDLGLLQAGAGIKGEFENRLKASLTKSRPPRFPLILFIDEAHTLIGAGGQAGSGDAANLLKPALARGELRTIAATTWAEYKKYFEKDAAMARRFQVVKVEEPDEEKAMVMMRGHRAVSGKTPQRHDYRRGAGRYGFICPVATFQVASFPTRRSAYSIPPAHGWPSGSPPAHRPWSRPSAASVTSTGKSRASSARRPSAEIMKPAWRNSIPSGEANPGGNGQAYGEMAAGNGSGRPGTGPVPGNSGPCGKRRRIH